MYRFYYLYLSSILCCNSPNNHTYTYTYTYTYCLLPGKISIERDSYFTSSVQL